LEERAKSAVQASSDVLGKIRKSTLCGTDLYSLCGDAPTGLPGTVLGHEGVSVKVDLHAERLGSHEMTVTTVLVDTASMPMLRKTLQP
jgi:threonine dehydrogenase-like Zn-dependent dehydrogenase